MHGAPIDLPWIDRVPVVLDMFFPGMEGGTAMADILFGDADPSGRLTFSWPERLEDSPVYELATQDVDNVNYEDSLMVGYRYFDTKRVTPRYEFEVTVADHQIELYDFRLFEDESEKRRG